MELIYADPNREDIGILKDYEFDLAYGEDENDFELQLALKNHCMRDDYIVYMVDTQNRYEAGTEYGGIVDDIKVNTEDSTVTYIGRTWHGIMSEKVIEPDEGQDYYTVTGNAHDILKILITRLGLENFFTVPDEDSEIQIPEYSFRYADFYVGVSDMLAENGGKLKITYENKMVVLSAVWLVDYSQSEEWDSSQVSFEIKKRINPINHLVCLGQGDLKDRVVIHLFTDENGGVQPYANIETPLEDSDYILDKRNQLLFGTYEIAEVYDYPSAGITENYVRLSAQPDDWTWNYSAYYYLGNGDSWRNPEAHNVETLKAVSTQPSDWSTKYGNYFTSNGKAVTGINTQSYVALTKKPSDWTKNWGNYYIHFWNGVEYKWENVDTVTWDTYSPQTKQPSDWKENSSSYYQRKVITETVKDKNGKVVKDKNGKTVKKTKIGKGYETVRKVKKGKSEVTPKWQKGKYFTKYSHRKAPAFESGMTKYKLTQTTSAPTFTANTYYKKITVLQKPVFKPNVYYKKVYDRYAELVKAGIKKLSDTAANSDTIEIDLDLLGEYDVGDIVGAAENTTGIEVWQPITKKIVSISKTGRSISYRIGDIKV